MEVLIAVFVLVACIIIFNGWESISHLDAWVDEVESTTLCHWRSMCSKSCSRKLCEYPLSLVFRRTIWEPDRL